MELPAQPFIKSSPVEKGILVEEKYLVSPQDRYIVSPQEKYLIVHQESPKKRSIQPVNSSETPVDKLIDMERGRSLEYNHSNQLIENRFSRKELPEKS